MKLFVIAIFGAWVFGLSIEFGISTAKLLRAHGGCLGIKSEKGVEVCEMPGGVDKQAMIPGFLKTAC